jgi:hypothetical protein
MEPTQEVRDEDRIVDLSDDAPLLPASTRDDTDEGWGESSRERDDWLLEERPPHWDS